MYRCMHKYLNIKCLFSGPQTQQKVQPHDSCIKKIAALRIENEQLYAELARLQTENAELSSKIRDFDIEEQLISNDSKTKFYTGIPTKAVFMWLLAFCTSVLPVCKVMSPKCIPLCILMKLRSNLPNQDLVYRFNVSVTTISDIYWDYHNLPRNLFF